MIGSRNVYSTLFDVKGTSRGSTLERVVEARNVTFFTKYNEGDAGGIAVVANVNLRKSDTICVGNIRLRNVA